MAANYLLSSKNLVACWLMDLLQKIMKNGSVESQFWRQQVKETNVCLVQSSSFLSQNIDSF